MQIKTKAIVLKATDYNENDKLLILLTEEMGIVYAYAPGARKIKGKLSPSVSMLCYGEFVLFKKNDKYVIDSAEPERLFYGIRENLDSLAFASYFCEICIETVTSEEKQTDILKLFLNTLHFLETKKMDSTILKSIFELRMMSLIGFAPELIACSECGDYQKNSYWFDCRNGNATCTECKAGGNKDDVLISGSAFLAARHITYAPLNQLYSFKIGENAKIELSIACEKYFITQIDKKLPTLDFLNSIRSF